MPRPPTYVTVVINDDISENDAADASKRDGESQCDHILPAPVHEISERRGRSYTACLTCNVSIARRDFLKSVPLPAKPRRQPKPYLPPD
jgi:hypothetical protein